MLTAFQLFQKYKIHLSGDLYGVLCKVSLGLSKSQMDLALVSFCEGSAAGNSLLAVLESGMFVWSLIWALFKLKFNWLSLR